MKEWKSKIFEAMAIVVAVAVAGRLIAGLLQPLLPVLAVVLILLITYGALLRKHK